MKHITFLTCLATFSTLSRNGLVSAVIPNDLLLAQAPFWEYFFTYTDYRDALPEAEEVEGDSSMEEGEPVKEEYTRTARIWGFISDLDKDPCVELRNRPYDANPVKLRTSQNILRLPYVDIKDAQPQIIGWNLYNSAECDGEPLYQLTMSSDGYYYRNEGVWSVWNFKTPVTAPDWNANPFQINPIILSNTRDDDPQVSWRYGSSQVSDNASPERDDKKSDSPFAQSPGRSADERVNSFQPIYGTNINIGWAYTNPDIPELVVPRLYTPPEAVLVYKGAVGVFNPLELKYDRRSYPHDNFMDANNRKKCFQTYGKVVGFGTLQYEFKVKPDPEKSKYQIVGIIFYNDLDCGDSTIPIADEDVPLASYPADRTISEFDYNTFERYWDFKYHHEVTNNAKSYRLVFAEAGITDDESGDIVVDGKRFFW